ncbi:L,D-transpeptidase family protein [Persicirhabdus sediminis]|uniref:L,D-transpeptidase family protein n=1 Tax=Persicirhabdus sediminis TaxID=454144 RepID=A0A8J7MFL1_9BACT|nr:L,D-transpeptidase family protein [Persicirhabdus sediminis]MBK1792117.1 L,D-transpeptidase family protein [Persicirhabdus sediminis]
MAKRFQDLGPLTNGEPMSILAFKKEQRLELWKQRESGWEMVCSYPFTGYSGTLGPKLEEGDGQIPEGIYQIEYLNPNSSYHLSIKLDYPNSFDRKMADVDGREELGFDIFIHGSSATIGCIPIGDEAIEELFYLIAKNGYSNVTTIITPVDFRLGAAPPEVDGIGWEADLYAKLSKRLKDYPIPENPNNEDDNKEHQLPTVPPSS